MADRFGLTVILLLGAGLFMFFAAQAETIRFESIGLAEGLPQSDAAVIAQDLDGYIWLGTQQGLARYDGHEFEIHRHSPGDDSSLDSSVIGGILVSKQGHLWVGTHSGLNRFDPRTRRSQRIGIDPRDADSLRGRTAVIPVAETDSGDLIVEISGWPGLLESGSAQLKLMQFSIPQQQQDTSRGSSLLDESGRFWTLTRNGLWKRDRRTGILELVMPIEQDSQWRRSAGRRLAGLPDGQLAVATDDGLRIFNPSSLKMTGHFRPVSFGHRDDRIDAIVVDGSGAIWLALSGELVRLAALSDWQPVAQLPELDSEAGIRWQLNAAELPDGEVWLANQYAVFRYLPERDVVSVHRHKPSDPDSIVPTPPHGAYQLFADRDGTLWIGSRLGGVSRYSPQRNRFELIRAQPVDDAGFLAGHNIVRAVVELKVDGREELWLALEWDGIQRLQRQSDGTYQLIDHFHDGARKEQKLPDNHVYGMAVHPITGEVWASTLSRIVRIDPATSRTEVLTTDSSELDNLSIFALAIAPDGKSVWIGTSRGAFGFWLSEGTSLHIFHRPMLLADESVLDLITLPGGKVLAASRIGIVMIDPDSRQEWLFASSGAVDSELLQFYGFAIDAEGSIWVGGRLRGLTRLDLFMDDFGKWRANQTVYGAGEGLLDETIYAVLPQKDGRLWLSSNRGLMRWCPRTHQTEHYTPRDGLQDYEFNNTVAHIGESGRYYFGGINGVNAFRPEQITAHPVPPAVRMESMQVNDQHIDLATQNLWPIDLSHRENYVVMHFTALHFADPDRNRYAYRLQGLEPDWVDAGSIRLARYPALRPGNYGFLVRAANSDGVWSEPELLAEFRIQHPPWQRGWAWAVYLSALIGVVALLVMLQVWRRRELEHLVEKRTSELAREQQLVAQQAHALRQVLETRTNFFANISHEFRTPITLIQASLEKLQKGDSDPAAANLGRRYLKRLLRLVDQMLDLAKAHSETGLEADQPWLLPPVIQFICESLRSSAEHKDITLSLDAEPGWHTRCSREMVEKILLNLLTNALKYTPVGGKVHVSLHGREDRFELAVTDTGPGIPPEEHEHVFERFQRARHAENSRIDGTGIGLALVRDASEAMGGGVQLESKLGQGSRFIVTLPGRAEGEITLPAPLPHEAQNPAAETQSGQLDHKHRLPERKAANESVSSPKPLLGSLLVVEDNADLRAHLRSVLQTSWSVIEAEDGRQGLRKAIQYMPDVIVSDVMMPGMDGFTALKALREDDRTSHIPVLLLTARADAKARLQGYRLSADDFLEKPFQTDELQLRLERMIANRRRLWRHLKDQLSGKSSDQSGKQPDNPDDPVGEKYLLDRDRVLLERLHRWLERHYTDAEVNVETMCRNLAIEPRTLQRKLKAFTGETPAEYLRNYRLDRAADQLRTTRRSVIEIALNCGFSTPQSFSRQFRKSFGQSPANWRD